MQEDCKNVVKQSIGQLQGLDIIISNAVSTTKLDLCLDCGLVDCETP